MQCWTKRQFGKAKVFKMRSDIFDVTGKIAVVTGASAGLGKAVASTLADAGAKVLGVARRADELERWSRQTEGETAFLSADLSAPSSVSDLAKRAEAVFGAADILVNAAGVNTRQHANTVSLEGWQQTLDLNLSVPFFLAQAMVPAMKAKGWGRIINFASLQSERAFPSGISYGASKAGVAQLTRAMAEAWSGDGINANALAPGFFPTELTAPVFNDPERAARNAAQTCIGRNGTMDDIVGPLLFLASSASDYVTGQVLYVDGGFTAK